MDVCELVDFSKEFKKIIKERIEWYKFRLSHFFYLHKNIETEFECSKKMPINDYVRLMFLLGEPL